MGTGRRSRPARLLAKAAFLTEVSVSLSGSIWTAWRSGLLVQTTTRG